MRTSATEVSIHAVSPELPVHFSITVAEQLGGGARPMKTAAASAGARPLSKRVSFMGSGLRIWKGKRRAWRLKRVLVRLARADPHRRVEVVDEDLAVADLAGARGSDDRFDHLVGDVRVN